VGRRSEYIKHLFVRTPLQPAIERLAHLRFAGMRFSNPELRGIYQEFGAIPRFWARVLRPESNGVDVGGHLGLVVNMFIHHAPRGRHTVVEAAPYKAAWLRKKFPEVRIEQCALSDREGEATFFIDRDSSGESALHDNGLGHAMEKVVVPMKRLDGLLAPDHRVDFIKIDVEGAELDVLKGATGTLARWRPPVLFESTATCLKNFGRTPADMAAFFESMGWGLWTVIDWLDGKPALTREEFVKAHDYPFRAFNFLAISPEHPMGKNHA